VKNLQIDVVGDWSEKKLKIVEKYVSPYSKILSSHRFYYIYVDAFAGVGQHFSRTTLQLIKGSPKLALESNPPFSEYHFIEQDATRVNVLKELASEHENVVIHQGDCNEILNKSIIPWIDARKERRALCFLDPYKLNYSWDIIEKLGKGKRTDLLLNFMIFDAQRNILRKDQELVSPKEAERLTNAWGDESWREAVFIDTKQQTLFETSGEPKGKVTCDQIAKAYKARIQHVAGFAHVLDPIAMLNSRRGVIYYLFFASQQPVAAKIMKDIVKSVMMK
jgi:three-Cys-motif partner protein